MPVVQVALPVPLPRLFDYLLPADAPQPVAGARVSVPFGNRKMTGIVVSTRATSDLPLAQLKQRNGQGNLNNGHVDLYPVLYKGEVVYTLASPPSYFSARRRWLQAFPRHGRARRIARI